MNACGGIDVEVSKAIELWSKEILDKHCVDEDDKTFFRALIKQCISMKLIGDKASSIMSVLKLGRRKHVYPQKSVAMKEWPMSGLDVLYDSFNARDGVVSDELIDEILTGILARMVFNARVKLRLGTYSEEVVDVKGFEEEKEISTNGIEVEPREHHVEESTEEGMKRWDGLGFDSASPSPEESLPIRYGFGSEDLLSLSNYSTRNKEDSGSRSETAHGGLTGGPVSGEGSIESES